MHLKLHDFFLLYIEQKLSQDWPVSAEVDLDDMEYHEGKEKPSVSTYCTSK